ncbi:Uncharacterised protein [Streptococcus pneumoniae]|nr:Uncharacterised protein [Streptococcus pneumoniae]
MASNRTISVNTSEHDVLLTARKNHPAVFVDGMFLDGVETNPFPLNDITLLEKLFGQSSNGQSLRDIVVQTLEDDD